MSYAIIVHKEAFNVDGGPLAVGAIRNTFYARKLTDMIVNEGNTTVAAFRPHNAAINANQFDLTPGVYRITADITICNYNNQELDSVDTRCGLFNVTSGDFEYYFGSTTEKILSTSTIIRSRPGGGYPEANALCHMDALFNVTSVINSFEIRQAVTDGVSQPTSTDVLGDKSTCTQPAEYYAFIKILKMS